jgi:trehalose-6-phosphatase
MLRHILLIRLKPEVTTERVDAFMQAIEALPFPGRHNTVVGRDIGVRPGNMDLAVSNDFTDEATFRAWGDDSAHAQVRNELLVPIAERIERCLFYV